MADLKTAEVKGAPAIDYRVKIDQYFLAETIGSGSFGKVKGRPSHLI